MCLAIPARVVAIIDPIERLARVEIAGVERTIDISLLNADGDGERPVAPEDWVLVHVGFAISRMDAHEAAATLQMLQALGAEYDQEIALLEEE